MLNALIAGLLVASAAEPSAAAVALVKEFKAARYFGEQARVAKKLIALRDAGILPALEEYLSAEDRHLRGNAAFVFAGLGDDRGFEVIKAIVNDRSNRPFGQLMAVCTGLNCVMPQEQIKEDRYYAVHLLGDLKDARAVPLLIPLLQDVDVAYIAPWSLGQIGDRRALQPLLHQLHDRNPDLRALAICALESLGDRRALPALRALLKDQETIQFDGLGPVSEAAREALDGLNGKHKPAESKCGRGRAPG